jgi:hypothetical protein
VFITIKSDVLARNSTAALTFTVPTRRDILVRPDVAGAIIDMDLPGFRP